MKRFIVVFVLILALALPAFAQTTTIRPPVQARHTINALRISCDSGGVRMFNLVARSIVPDPIPGWVRINTGGVYGIARGIVRTNMECHYYDLGGSTSAPYWRYGYPGAKHFQCFGGTDIAWSDNARSISTDTLPGWVRVHSGPIDAANPGHVRTNMRCVFIQK